MKEIPNFPPDTKEKVLALCETLDSGCMIMTRSLETPYGTISREYSISRPTTLVHRFLYFLTFPNADPSTFRLKRTCDTVGCANPRHYQGSVANVPRPKSWSTGLVPIPVEYLEQLEVSRSTFEDVDYNAIRQCLSAIPGLRKQEIELCLYNIRRSVSTKSTMVREGEIDLICKLVKERNPTTYDEFNELARLLAYQARITEPFFWKTVEGRNELYKDFIVSQYPGLWERFVEMTDLRDKARRERASVDL